MNMLQKNPRDPKHNEFHDGEYEYWPVEGSHSGRKTGFPTALLNGLNLVAAAAAAALLAAALSLLYTQSSVLRVFEEQATINVKVFNNYDGVQISYDLLSASDPDAVLQSGMIEENEKSLKLQNLEPGTGYVLRYFSWEDGTREPLGNFSFSTIGDPPRETGPILSKPTEPEETTEPTTEPMTEGTTEPTTEPTTEATTEPATEPTKPAPKPWRPRPTEPEPEYVPPKPTEPKPTEPKPTEPKPTEPSTEPTTEATTEPTTEPTTEATTEPTTEPTTEATTEPTTTVPNPLASEPRIDEESVIANKAEIEASLYQAVYSFRQIHSFQNIPEGGYEIKVVQDGNEIVEGIESWISEDGLLMVSFMGNDVRSDSSTATYVTVIWDNGVKATSEFHAVMPVIKTVDLNVTKNTDGTHTFTATVTGNPDSDFSMLFETFLEFGDENWTRDMELQPTGDNVYTGTYTAHVDLPEGVEATAYLSVEGIWNMAGKEILAIVSGTDGLAEFTYIV